MSLTSRIQALTTYANEITGASDTTLADAVATLADGYGSGGGSSGVSSGSFVGDNTSAVTINTGLSSVRGFTIYRTDNGATAGSQALTLIIYDFDDNINMYVRANNAGTGLFALGGMGSITATNTDGIISVTSAARFRQDIPYKWIAW